jgi:hypothetical protein
MLFAIAGAIVANTACLAASPGTLTVNPDGRATHVAPAMHVAAAPRPRHTASSTIYDSFASLDPNGVYMAGQGNAFGDLGAGYSFKVAAAFTPAANATVGEIDVAAGQFGGKQKVAELHLYADSSGVPGTEIWSHEIVLPPDGTCCGVIATEVETGSVKLTGGTQYWVAITTATTAPGTAGSWYFNVADQVDAIPMAFWTPSGWNASPSLPNVAFAVYGK